MNGLRFTVDELAIFAVPSAPAGIGREGAVITIAAVGPFRCGDWIGDIDVTPRASGDYIIRWPDENLSVFNDWQLRKLDPPAEPKKLRRTEPRSRRPFEWFP